jgi:hypothetical protein
MVFRRTCSGDRRAEGWWVARLLGIAILIVLAGAARPGVGDDLLGVRVASQEVRAAAESIAQVAEALPVELRQEFGSEVYVLARAAEDMVQAIEDQAVPIAEQSILEELDHLTDVIRSLESELAAIGQAGVLYDDLATRVHRLAAAGAAQVERIDGMLRDWADRTQHAVVELETEPELIAIRSIDRWRYDAIRYSALALLLVGLLAVGLQLLRVVVQRLDLEDVFRERPVLAAASLVALALFFGASLVLAVHPSVLAGLSAEVHIERIAHPCRTLEAQQARLASAQTIENQSLIEATKRRMQRVAQDCLGLEDNAVVRAVEKIAERTKLASAAATAEAPQAEAEPASTEPPATPEPAAEPPEESEAAASDRAVLSELLASLQRVEQAVASPARSEQTVASPTRGERDAETVSSREPAADAVPAAAPAQPEPRRLVTTVALNYRAGPGVTAQRLGTLVPGTEVEVLRQDGAWTEVRLSDGRQVFVANQYLAPAR